MRLIQRWAQESEFHEEHAAPRDPLQSELLAFGNVPVIAQQGSSTETVPVAAVAGGIGGDTVTLVRLNQEHLSWREIIPTQMESNIFQGGIESSWSGHDGTIQQLCFAQVIENKQVWLAVRYHANITVLPLLITEKGLLISPGLRLSQGVDRSRRFRSPGTTPLKLLYRRTGGYPHVDVAFNPWEARQFAVVDQEGHWSILAIESRSQREVLWEITGVTSGHVRGGLAEDDDSDGDFDDGWGRIIWLGDADTIAIASRNLLAAFSIEGAPRRLKVPHLGLAQFNDRILDLKRGTPDRGQAFLLTSTRMLLLQSHRRRDQDSQSTNVDISIILSWKHLRDPRDLSLKLSVVQDSKCKREAHFWLRLY
jgi:RNA polymerase I-specific transcription initiation factor RRN6